MKKNDPRRNLIQFWVWGPNNVEMYIEPKHAPRWIKNRGSLWSPCDVAGCKRHIVRGEWYIRHPGFGIVCRDCSVDFGAGPSEAMTREQDLR